MKSNVFDGIWLQTFQRSFHQLLHSVVRMISYGFEPQLPYLLLQYRINHFHPAVQIRPIREIEHGLEAQALHFLTNFVRSMPAGIIEEADRSGAGIEVNFVEETDERL